MFEKVKPLHAIIAITCMIVVIYCSNVLVQPPYHINEWLTWGAFTYPLAFLVTDLMNRRFGAPAARRMVYVSFAFAVLISYYFADARIALASGSAFLLAQLNDIYIFDKLRQKNWWKAPFFAGLIAAFIDTYVFFGLAFYGTGEPWLTLGLGDLGVKLAMNLLLLMPFRALMWNVGRPHISNT